MAFTSVLVKQGVVGDLHYEMGTFNSASGTAGTVVTNFRDIFTYSFRNDVTAGAGLVANPVAGNLVFSGLTSNDTGAYVVYGKY